MRLFCILSISLLIILNTSCKPILRVTLGKYLYKKDFLPTPTSQNNDFYTEVPYELREGWTIIKVRVNGSPKEYSFLFDTGARCYITDSLAKEVGGYVTKYEKSRDINGSEVYAGLYRLDIAIGQFESKNVGVLSKESFENLSNGCYQIDGIIGANILDQGVFHFDSENKILQITNSIDQIPKSKRQIELKVKTPSWSGGSYVKMKVNNQKGQFLFDTGSANLLSISQKERNKQIPVKRRIGYIGGLNSLKLDTISFYKIERIKIGKEEIEKFNKKVILSHSNSINILGNGVMGKYLVTLDRNNKRLYLSPRVDQIEDEELKISNLQLEWQSGRIVVSSLTIGSELQNMGLSLGDTVTFINDMRTDSFKDYCAFETFKDSLILTIKDADILLKTRRGTLEKSYRVTDNLLYD